MKKTDKIFDLEHQYQLFMERLNMEEPKMHPIQKIQLRQAFMGGCGQIMILMRDEVSELEEMDGIEVLDNMLEQVGEFWTKEMERDQEES